MVEQRRRSIRLRAYDYRSPGAYFVTVCTHGRKCLLDGREIREAVAATWRQIPQHFPHARIDEFVVMPNHVHGIICITSDAHRRNVGAQHAAPLQRAPAVTPGSLGAILRAFKAATTNRINEMRKTPGPA